MLNAKAITSLKYGYSTGTCAAAAAQAALRYLNGEPACNYVDIVLPQGGELRIPIQRVWQTEGGAGAEVQKDAGDDPDITHGTSIIAEVHLSNGTDICIEGGEGVGRVTKPGLPISPGEAAINPVPLQMIRQSLEAFIPPGQGARVVVSVPDGQRLALMTMNPRLGIEGGISILGTSGLVRPMSLDAWVESLLPQLDQARAYDFEVLVLTPGGSGEKAALLLGAPREAVIQCSNFFGAMLDASAEREFKGVIVLGQLGKMSKLAGGIMNTHSRLSREQVHILADQALAAGFSREDADSFRAAATAAEATDSLHFEQKQQLASAIAVATSSQCRAAVQNRLDTGCVITDRQGNVLGYDAMASQLWRKLSCRELLG